MKKIEITFMKQTLNHRMVKTWNNGLLVYFTISKTV